MSNCKQSKGQWRWAKWSLVCLLGLGVLSFSRLAEAEELPEAWPAEAPIPYWTGAVQVGLGQKWMNESQWQPLEVQRETTLEATWQRLPAPYQLLAGISASSTQKQVRSEAGSRVRLKVETWEARIGARWGWEWRAWHPFLNGGWALVRTRASAALENASARRSRRAPGIWGGGGFYFQWQRWQVGWQGWGSWAEVADSTNGGGLHTQLFFGWQW